MWHWFPETTFAVLQADVCFSLIPGDMPTHHRNHSGTIDLSGRKNIRISAFAASHNIPIVCDLPLQFMPHETDKHTPETKWHTL
ncbi:MAG: hypothetical protein C0467_06630 [Planctomycetaceae bacterium]|nr:hypothetical protein [Planctomycetaceae bacterium]